MFFALPCSDLPFGKKLGLARERHICNLSSFCLNHICEPFVNELKYSYAFYTKIDVVHFSSQMVFNCIWKICLKINVAAGLLSPVLVCLSRNTILHFSAYLLSFDKYPVFGSNDSSVGQLLSIYSQFKHNN